MPTYPVDVEREIPPCMSEECEPVEANPHALDRGMLLDMLAHQQRVAQAGLVTAGLIHDVRNHVQMLSGTAFLAKQGNDPQAWFDALESIQAACCELTRTTSSFLAFVKRRDVSANATFRVSDVLDSAFRILTTLAKRSFVELTVEGGEDALVAGDAQLAVQAVVNLASNAIRACQGGDGAVRITASCTSVGSARIEVVDTGPGIAEEMRASMFRPSVGADPAAGHGLGLFMVRQVVRRLGGSIRIETSAAGTTARIDLPVV